MKRLVTLSTVLMCCITFVFLFTGCGPQATISFDTGFDDVKVDSVTGSVGSKITAPDIPEKEGYKFIAWVKDGTKFEFDTMPSEDAVLTAFWLDMSYTEGSLPCMSIELTENGEEYPLAGRHLSYRYVRRYYHSCLLQSQRSHTARIR